MQLAAAGPPSSRLPCPLLHMLPRPLSIPLLPPPPCLQEAQACLEELSQAASLSGDLAAQLEGQMLAAALSSGQVKEGAKLPLLPPVVPPPPPVATVCTGTQTPAPAPAPAQAKQGLAAGFLGAAAKPAAAAAGKLGAAAETAAGPATPAQAAGEAAPTAADQHPAAPQQAAAAAAAAAAAGARQGRPSRPSRPSRPGSAGGSRPEVAIDPLHQLVARTDANQGRQGASCTCSAAAH